MSRVSAECPGERSGKKQKTLSSVGFAVCRVFKGHYELPKSRWAVDVRPNLGRSKNIFSIDHFFFSKIFFDQKKSENRVEKKKVRDFFSRVEKLFLHEPTAV